MRKHTRKWKVWKDGHVVAYGPSEQAVTGYVRKVARIASLREARKYGYTVTIGM